MGVTPSLQTKKWVVTGTYNYRTPRRWGCGLYLVRVFVAVASSLPLVSCPACGADCYVAVVSWHWVSTILIDCHDPARLAPDWVSSWKCRLQVLTCQVAILQTKFVQIKSHTLLVFIVTCQHLNALFLHTVESIATLHVLLVRIEITESPQKLQKSCTDFSFFQWSEYHSDVNGGEENCVI